MEYRKLGRTGLEASVIGFGAEWIGKIGAGRGERHGCPGRCGWREHRATAG